MVKCCVEGCESNSKYSGSDVTFHRFPDSRCFPFLFQKWLHKVTGVPYDQPVDLAVLTTSRVCSLHFTENDFVVKTDKNRTRRTLRVEALLSQRLPLSSLTDATEPFAIRNYVNGIFKNGSTMCINNNQVLSSHSKRTLYNGNELPMTKVPKKMKIGQTEIIPRNGQVQVPKKRKIGQTEIIPRNGQVQIPKKRKIGHTEIIPRNGQVQAGYYPVEGTNRPQQATYLTPGLEGNNPPQQATYLTSGMEGNNPPQTATYSTPGREFNNTPQRATYLTPGRECNNTPQTATFLTSGMEGNNPPQTATYSTPGREFNNTPQRATYLTPGRECNNTPQTATFLTSGMEGNNPPQTATYSTPGREFNNTPQRATYLTPGRECNNTPQTATFLTSGMEGNNPPQTATYLTPERECNNTPQRATYLTPGRECNNTPQSSTYLTPESESATYSTPETEYSQELEANIPACFRAKENVYSPFALSITHLEPEFGFNVILVNDNKYIKCDPADGDSQIWRCIIKSCSACIVTSCIHWSIVFSLRGDHYHFPSKEFLLDPSEWVLGTPGTPWMIQQDERPQSDGTSAGFGRDSGCEQSLVEGDMSPWGGQYTLNSPTQPQPDSQFNATGLPTPDISQFQLPYSQHPPTLTYPPFSSLEALSKFCGGQVTERNPFDGSQSTSFALMADENAVSGSYPQMENVVVSPESHPVILASGSMTPEEEAEYILQSPVSEQTNALTDETCEGSSSERMSTLTEEPVYYELIDGDAHDVHNAQDPLDINSQQMANGNRSPTTPKGELAKEDRDFFRTLGPYLNRLSAEDKNVFKEQIVCILTDMCTDSEE